MEKATSSLICRKVLPNISFPPSKFKGPSTIFLVLIQCSQFFPQLSEEPMFSPNGPSQIPVSAGAVLPSPFAANLYAFYPNFGFFDTPGQQGPPSLWPSAAGSGLVAVPQKPIFVFAPIAGQTAQPPFVPPAPSFGHGPLQLNAGKCQVPDADTEEWGSREDGEDGGARRKRNLFRHEQVQQLESVYRVKQFINQKERHELARRCNLRAEQVKIWFQNRRYKQRKKDKDQQFMAAQRQASRAISQQNSSSAQLLPTPLPSPQQKVRLPLPASAIHPPLPTTHNAVELEVKAEPIARMPANWQWQQRQQQLHY